MGAPPSKDAILLSEVRSLTLRGHGAVTTHRRVAAAPQLKCVSGAELCQIGGDVDVMRCANAGAGYGREDIQWECTASLPETVRLTETEVICEGYRSPEDEYILRGSCGVEYRLALTDLGRARYPDLVSDPSLSSHGGIPGFLFALLFMGVLFWICRAAFLRWMQNAPRLGGAAAVPRRGPDRGGWNPGWGGGPDDDNDNNGDPPPPYPGTGSQKPSSASRPGFWTGVMGGAAGGAAAGYAAGRYHGRTARDQARMDRMDRAMDYGYYDSPPAPLPTPRQTSGPAPSAPSTGFGGTSRR